MASPGALNPKKLTIAYRGIIAEADRMPSPLPSPICCALFGLVWMGNSGSEWMEVCARGRIIAKIVFVSYYNNLYRM